MKSDDTNWTREQLLLTLNLYTKLPFGRLSKSTPEVRELAKILGRTDSAVAMKLVNFASIDPRLKQKGLSGTSKLDKIVWAEYMQNWDEMFFEGEEILAKKQNTTLAKLYNVDLDGYDKSEGKEIERVVKVRVYQQGFRAAVLTNYNNKCCITGIGMTELLVASHILPWSKGEAHRLNPENGFALNALHDKAFDRHLITITEDLTVKIAPVFYKHKEIESIQQNFINYDGKRIADANKFYPKTDFLKIHNEKFEVHL